MLDSHRKQRPKQESLSYHSQSCMRQLISHIETVLGSKIDYYQPVSGGDINEAFLLKTDSRYYFMKMNSSVSAFSMLEAECFGLKEISKSKTISMPEIVKLGQFESHAYLILEFIESGRGTSDQFSTFGEQLAKLHDCSHSNYGWESDNFIGSLPQSNTSTKSWPEFYVQQRLIPQLNLAKENRSLSESEIPLESALMDTVEKLCNDVKPSLLHGDLWSGNFIIDKTGTPILIDPAVYYGDRMVDIAMSKLFGGFQEKFYDTYYFNSPKINNKKEKIDLYQLYYLLVHLNLFGSSYKNSVTNILKRLF